MDTRQMANAVESKGRYGDTMLVHMNPAEVAGIAALSGGSLPTNPDTGKPEAFVFLAPLLAMGGGMLGGAMAGAGATAMTAALYTGLGAAAGGMAGSLIQGDSFKDSLRYGALSGITAGAMSGLASAFSPAAEAGAKGAAQAGTQAGAKGAEQAAGATAAQTAAQKGAEQAGHLYAPTDAAITWTPDAGFVAPAVQPATPASQSMMGQVYGQPSLYEGAALRAAGQEAAGGIAWDVPGGFNAAPKATPSLGDKIGDWWGKQTTGQKALMGLTAAGVIGSAFEDDDEFPDSTSYDAPLSLPEYQRRDIVQYPGDLTAYGYKEGEFVYFPRQYGIGGIVGPALSSGGVSLVGEGMEAAFGPAPDYGYGEGFSAERAIMLGADPRSLNKQYQTGAPPIVAEAFNVMDALGYDTFSPAALDDPDHGVRSAARMHRAPWEPLRTGKIDPPDVSKGGDYFFAPGTPREYWPDRYDYSGPYGGDHRLSREEIARRGRKARGYQAGGEVHPMTMPQGIEALAQQPQQAQAQQALQAPEAQQSLQETGGIEGQVITEAKLALMGQHPTPDVAVQLFVQMFGPDALEELRREVMIEMAGGPADAATQEVQGFQFGGAVLANQASQATRAFTPPPIGYRPGIDPEHNWGFKAAEPVSYAEQASDVPWWEQTPFDPTGRSFEELKEWSDYRRAEHEADDDGSDDMGGVDTGDDDDNWQVGGVIHGPGTGTSDSVPIMASRGEYVLPEKTVQQLGKQNLDRIVKQTTGKTPNNADVRPILPRVA